MKFSNICRILSFIYSIFLPCLAFAGSVTLEWQPNEEPDLKEYFVHYSESSRVYGPPVSAGLSTQYTLDGLQEGRTYYFAVTAVDTAGNESGYSSEASKHIAYVDNQSPTISILSPVSGGTFNTDQSVVTVSGNASDNVSVSRVTWSSSQGGSGTASGAASWKVENIALSEGENSLSFTAYDTAGNQTTSTIKVVYTSADAVPPSVQITSPSESTIVVTGDNTIDLAGIAYDDRAVEKITWTNSAGGSGVANGTINWEISGLTLHDGQNQITVKASDAAGNESIDSLLVTYTPAIEDTTVPDITISSPTSGRYYFTSRSSITLSGTASDDQGLEKIVWKNSKGGSGIASNTLSWTISNVIIYKGLNTVTITAIDSAGNQSSDDLLVMRWR